MFLNIRLNIIRWFKDNKRKIYIILTVWAIMVFLNYLFGALKGDPKPITAYEPHISIMNDQEEVPKKLQKPINETFEKYFNYCNNGQYSEAYNMLSAGCKKNIYPTEESFIKYAKSIFKGKKIYNIQNYSVTDNIYIYNLRILDDVLATGTTGEEELLYYEEKAVIEEIDGQIYLSIGGYVTEKKLDTLYEDKTMKLTITNVLKLDEYEIYTVNISNKTDNIIVLSDGGYHSEILLKVGSDLRNLKRNVIEPIVIYPGEKRTFEFKFTKFYDEEKKSDSMVFNTVYILKEYGGDDETIEKQKENAVDAFSFTLPIQ